MHIIGPACQVIWSFSGPPFFPPSGQAGEAVDFVFGGISLLFNELILWDGRTDRKALCQRSPMSETCHRTFYSFVLKYVASPVLLHERLSAIAPPFVFSLRYDRRPCRSPFIPQLTLFQFALPGTSGNNERRGHGKIICLPSSPHSGLSGLRCGPSVCLSLRLVFDTILNLSLTSSNVNCHLSQAS